MSRFDPHAWVDKCALPSYRWTCGACFWHIYALVDIGTFVAITSRRHQICDRTLRSLLVISPHLSTLVTTKATVLTMTVVQ